MLALWIEEASKSASNAATRVKDSTRAWPRQSPLSMIKVSKSKTLPVRVPKMHLVIPLPQRRRKLKSMEVTHLGFKFALGTRKRTHLRLRKARVCLFTRKRGVRTLRAAARNIVTKGRLKVRATTSTPTTAPNQTV